MDGPRGSRVALRARRRRATVLADDLFQIAPARPRPELVQPLIGARRVRELGPRAIVVPKVPEGDRLRRARLLARGLDVAVAHRTLGVAMRVVLARHDALHTHRAL